MRTHNKFVCPNKITQKMKVQTFQVAGTSWFSNFNFSASIYILDTNSLNENLLKLSLTSHLTSYLILSINTCFVQQFCIAVYPKHHSAKYKISSNSNSQDWKKSKNPLLALAHFPYFNDKPMINFSKQKCPRILQELAALQGCLSLQTLSIVMLMAIFNQWSLATLGALQTSWQIFRLQFLSLVLASSLVFQIFEN